MRIFQEPFEGTSGEPMERKGWDHWAEGTGCPLCGPRHESNEYWDFIARLDVSSLHLSKNQAYRGHCLLILDIRHATRPDHLSPSEWTAFCTDLYAAEKALIRTLQPDHINIEVMGNVIPHLHWQIVPRYRTDPRWGAPIWMTTISEMPVTTLSETARTELVQNLRNAINQEILGGVD
jgi:diadenosine tetraphosphate (Ap4A) HIT family hydrolase